MDDATYEEDRVLRHCAVFSICRFDTALILDSNSLVNRNQGI